MELREDRDVGDGELTGEIILAADRIVQSAEPALDEFDQARTPKLRTQARTSRSDPALVELYGLDGL